jgi:hypothetical protein
MSLHFKSIAICFLLASAFGVRAQPKMPAAGPLSPENAAKLHTAEDTLALLAYAVVNDSLEQERFAACRALIISLKRNLKTENSFRYKFDRLQSISILTPPDSSFRIFSWQLFVNDSTYKYYGAIQMNQSDLKLYPLIDKSADMQTAPKYELLHADHWYGSLYYNMRQFDTKEGHKYLLFGYDAFEFFSKRKIIDVLTFDNEGRPVFGAPVFDRGADKNKLPEMRVVLEYSAEANVRSNWDEQYNMVLFDHLIDMASPFGRGITAVPDGSYDGFKLEKGRWKYISKVFNDVNKDVPVPNPILDNRKGKDLMGKEKKERAWKDGRI